MAALWIDPESELGRQRKARDYIGMAQLTTALKLVKLVSRWFGLIGVGLAGWLLAALIDVERAYRVIAADAVDGFGEQLGDAELANATAVTGFTR